MQPQTSLDHKSKFQSGYHWKFTILAWSICFNYWPSNLILIWIYALISWLCNNRLFISKTGLRKAANLSYVKVFKYHISPKVFPCYRSSPKTVVWILFILVQKNCSAATAARRLFKREIFSHWRNSQKSFSSGLLFTDSVQCN